MRDADIVVRGVKVKRHAQQPASSTREALFVLGYFEGRLQMAAAGRVRGEREPCVAADRSMSDNTDVTLAGWAVGLWRLAWPTCVSVLSCRLCVYGALGIVRVCGLRLAGLGG